MGKYYDNSIIPDFLRRNFNVYDRINKLSIDLGSFEDNVKTLKDSEICTEIFHESGLVYLSGHGYGPGQMYDDKSRITEGQKAAEWIANSMIRRLHWAITCGGEG